MIVLGIGMGTVLVSSNIAAQNSVSVARMGVTMSAINFTRQIGGTIGVAAAGAVMLTSLTRRRAAVRPGGAGAVAGLLAPGSGVVVPEEARETVRLAFADSLHRAFVLCAVVGAVGVLSSLLVPKGDIHSLRHREDETPAGDGPAASGGVERTGGGGAAGGGGGVAAEGGGATAGGSAAAGEP
jgi:hypothetical protein